MTKGYSTSEFWLSLVAVLIGFAMSSGLIAAGSTWERVLGLAASLLGALGYTASRAIVKSANSKASALTAAASAVADPSKPPA